MQEPSSSNSGAMVDVLAQCYQDTGSCGRVLFPSHFSTPDSDLHRQIDAAIDDPNIRKVCIAAPRGIGKTTRMSIGKCAQGILFGKYKFITYVSNAFESAQRQTNNLKRELMSNEEVKTLFGSIKPEKVQGMEEDFSKVSWVAQSRAAGTKTIVLPRGYGQQIRGLKFGAQRPDLLIFDDLEETELLHNELQRKKLKDWFFSDALECIDQRTDANYKIIYIDTLKHEDSLLAHLLELPDWHGIRLSICDENYNSLAPEFKSTELIKQMVENARASGTLDHFYREHMSEAVSQEDASFKPDYFKYYEETEEALTGNIDVENFVIVDPAKTAKATSAYSAVVGVGVNLRTNAIYVRDLKLAHLERDQLMTEALHMCERLNARVLGVEVTGLDQWIEQPFRDEITRKGMNVQFVPLHAKRGRAGTELAYEGGKVARISGLVPYYRRGLIFHNKNVCGPLEQQLRSFPRSKRWDAMDALAYIIELLDYGERYFWPERATDPNYDIESEYDEIDRDYNLPDHEDDDATDYVGFDDDWDLEL